LQIADCRTQIAERHSARCNPQSELCPELNMRWTAVTRTLLLTLTAPALLAAQATTTSPPRPIRPVARAVPPAPTAPINLDSAVFGGLRWRDVGPPRGGRSVAVAGSVARPNEYWMGTTGGGVFKTTDGGQTWAPMSDRFFGGTIGAIAVDEQPGRRLGRRR
jgi:hypothetical protein